MTYKIVTSETFEDDLDNALKYISRRLYNPNAAKMLLKNLDNTISLIEENPMLFPLYHDDKLAKEGLRYTVISNYLLFYKVHDTEKTVELSQFIFGNRNITDIF